MHIYIRFDQEQDLWLAFTKATQRNAMYCVGSDDCAWALAKAFFEDDQATVTICQPTEGIEWKAPSA